MVEKEHLIDLKGISKEYDGVKVLKNINLYIRRKEFVTLLGPSGCGKTTTLRIIGGFETATEGTLLFEGKDIGHLPPYKRRVNTVFQKYALFPHLNVFNNIAFGLKLKKLPGATIEKKVKQALRMVGMTDYEDRDVDSLSGGQQQRVAIARAIASKPPIILADEPTGNLDSRVGNDILQLLTDLHKAGHTVILITHITPHQTDHVSENAPSWGRFFM